MRTRALAVIALATLLALVLLGCSLTGSRSSRITPTPTKTLRPLFTATHTPMASPLPTST